MCRNDPGGDFERREQARGPMALVVVTLDPSRRVRSAALSNLAPAPRLKSTAFRLRRENNRLSRRIDIKAHHVGSFRRKLWVVALTPGLAGREVDIVLAQEAPDILNMQRHPTPWPTMDRSIGHNLEAAAYPGSMPKSACAWLCRRSASCPRAADPSALQGHDRQNAEPVADNARLNSNFLGDRAYAALRRLQYSAPASRRPASCSGHGIAPQAPCVSSLAPNLSCFGR